MHINIFSGISSISLAQEVTASLGAEMGSVDVTRFANGEMRVWVKEAHIGSSAVIIQSLGEPVGEHLIELGLLGDALTRLGVTDLTVVIPWLGYSKQDKVFREGEALSVKVIANMLQVIPIKRLITFDLHNQAILGFFDVPVANLSASGLFLDYFKHRITQYTVIVAPDAGAVKASTLFAERLGVPVVYVDKKRDITTGEVTVIGMSREVRGAEVIILDDMIVTGDTLIETTKHLKEAGAARVSVAATHHLWVPGTQQKLDTSDIDEVIVTDTLPPKAHSEKVTILTVAGLIAQALKKSG